MANRLRAAGASRRGEERWEEEFFSLALCLASRCFALFRTLVVDEDDDDDERDTETIQVEIYKKERNKVGEREKTKC